MLENVLALIGPFRDFFFFFEKTGFDKGRAVGALEAPEGLRSFLFLWIL
jgi:hypothetical protein